MMYVYILYNDDDCIYVGQTSNLERRIDEHKNRFKGLFNRHEVISCNCNSVDDIEAEMIVKLQPTYNKELPSNSKYAKYQDVESAVFECVTKSLLDQGFAFSTPANYTRCNRWLDGLNVDEFLNQLELRIKASKKLKELNK